MQKTLTAFIFFLILGVVDPRGFSAASELLPLTLIEIEDGDTIVALVEGNSLRLQLLGIDAPEDKVNPKLARDTQRTGLPAETLLPLGTLATKHLQSLAEPGESLLLAEELGQPDRYGRIPAVVVGSDGRTLNRAMVEDGFAIALEEPADADSLLQSLPHLEQEAITAGRGIWGSHPEVATSWRGR